MAMPTAIGHDAPSALVQPDLGRIGLGTAALGHLYAPVGEDVAIATVDAAWQAGIRFFDTAHLYGGGLAEERLGRALAGRTRDEYRLATKIGCYRPFGQGPIPPGETRRRAADVWDYSYDRTLAAVETSLSRLKTDRLDIVHIHGFDNHVETAFDGALRALQRLKQEGVVRAIGGACDAIAPLLAGLERGSFDTVLCAGRYTLLDRSGADSLIPIAAASNVEILVAGVFNSGILATGPVPGARFDYSDADPAILDRVRRLERTCDDATVSLPAAALQFPLRNHNISAILLGSASVEELGDCMARLAEPIAEPAWREIDAAITARKRG
jgi:D-threo-aldose 1-dehydrogenase